MAQPQRSPLGLWITIERPMTDLLPCSFTWLGLGLGLGLGIGLGLGLGLCETTPTTCSAELSAGWC